MTLFFAWCSSSRQQQQKKGEGTYCYAKMMNVVFFWKKSSYFKIKEFV